MNARFAAVTLALGAALLPATATRAAPEELRFSAKLVSNEVELGADLVIAVTVENPTTEPVGLPELRLASDSITVDVSGETVRDTTVTRLFGEFRTFEGSVRFAPEPTRRRDVPPGGVVRGSVRFPAVATGELELTVRVQVEPGDVRPAGVLKANVSAADDEEGLTARVETSQGAFRVRLDGGRAFNSVAHFWHLARTGFYAKLPFHRVIPDHVLQTGDPRGDGTGTCGWYLPSEPADEPPQRGDVALARGMHRGSASSQWFVALADCEEMPEGGLAVIGAVVEGMDVVDRLGSTELIPGSESPREPDEVRRIATEPR